MGNRWSAAFALGCAGLAATADEPPDRILVNGRVLTVDAADRVAEALAIRDGRILAVGTTEDIERLAGHGTERIDLAGRTATPGLIDAHAHFSSGGLLRLTQVDLSYPQVTGIADVVRLVGERAASARDGGWVLGRGWDEGKLAERRLPRASDIDAVTAGRPAWLVQTSGHYGLANSAALELAGITRDTPDPPGGTIDRDADGRPTGVLKESAMGLVTRHLPQAGPDTLREALRAMAREFNRECMTGVKDPGIGSGLSFDPDAALQTWNAYRDVLVSGDLTVRAFVLWTSPQNVDDARRLLALIEPFGKPAEGGGDGRLVSGGIKIFADGSGGARTAWMWQDWNRDRTGIDAGNRGYPAFDPAAIRDLIALYHDAGFHVGTHAIGDRTIDWVVDSYAAALQRKPVKGLRHSLIHANIPSGHALDVIAAMQREYDAVIPEPSPSFTWWFGATYAANFGPERSLRLNPFATFEKRGIRWASGSDYFVTPFPARYGIWAAVAREPLLNPAGDDPFGRAEAVDARAALRSFTINAAHQMFMDDLTGSLEPGKRADIAVWDRDFYQAPTADLKDASCHMTIFDGDVVHRSNRFP
jgi:predicted amidohydrolase YtcJ